jgi:hypothetical protein
MESVGLSVGLVGKAGPDSAYQLGGDLVYDQFDVTLEDVDLLGEVELTTNLIIAASESEAHLSPEEIDLILGVVPPQPRREA